MTMSPLSARDVKKLDSMEQEANAMLGTISALIFSGDLDQAAQKAEALSAHMRAMNNLANAMADMLTSETSSPSP